MQGGAWVTPRGVLAGQLRLDVPVEDLEGVVAADVGCVRGQ
jgi:hypothetical protein